MLNFEIADHQVYDGLELQWFDDAAHGTGMLAFLGRRDNHVFDYYAQRGLRLDPADYQIGAGTSTWVETDIADAVLEISDDGVHAAALFTDVDGGIAGLPVSALVCPLCRAIRAGRCPRGRAWRAESPPRSSSE